MKKEHQKRLVQVLAEPSADGEGLAVATGVAISAGRVLTCEHVLRGAKRVQVRFLEVDRERWLDAKVLWPLPRPGGEGTAGSSAHQTRGAAWEAQAGEGGYQARGAAREAQAGDGAGLDAAVLELDAAQVSSLLGGPVEPILGYASPGDRAEWCSRGMLRGAETQDREGRPMSEAIDFGGRLYQANAAGVMTLDADCSPRDPYDWQGGSGSPVMVADRLVAVLSSWPKAWAGAKLFALWVGELWKQPDFCKAAGLELEGEQYTKLRARVAQDLNAPELQLLRLELARLLGLEDSEGHQLVEHICGLSALELLGLSNAVLAEVLGSRLTPDRRLAFKLGEALVRLVEQLLPWGTLPEMLAALRREEKQGRPLYLQLPCASVSLAELYLARLGSRDARIAPRLLNGKVAVGELLAPLDPTTGFGVNPEHRTRQLLADLGLAHGFDVTAMTQVKLEVMAAQVNSAIQQAAEPKYGLPLGRPYLLYFRREDHLPAEGLKKLLPALSICRIDPNQPATEEGAICMQLQRFATHKQQLDTFHPEHEAHP